MFVVTFLLYLVYLNSIVLEVDLDIIFSGIKRKEKIHSAEIKNKSLPAINAAINSNQYRRFESGNGNGTSFSLNKISQYLDNRLLDYVENLTSVTL